MPSAHLLGVSGGGYLAQRLAIGSPERVSSLLLFLAAIRYATLIVGSERLTYETANHR